MYTHTINNNDNVNTISSSTTTNNNNNTNDDNNNILGIHHRGVQWEGGAVDGGSII